ncbi:protein kinase (incomplete catalytic triad) [Toxoplasma gondii VAND]|uniref:Protein kinase (Incomplete catalytic triad) n=1 Tax=Toxoplasma gondii VAND TaxID=933077 RepID=A0A086PJ05_TOXGO|nr:protein kinase (incomplete catalytic triad) [Toxoplasma gondii VAND]
MTVAVNAMVTYGELERIFCTCTSHYFCSTVPQSGAVTSEGELQNETGPEGAQEGRGMEGDDPTVLSDTARAPGDRSNAQNRGEKSDVNLHASVVVPRETDNHGEFSVTLYPPRPAEEDKQSMEQSERPESEAVLQAKDDDEVSEDNAVLSERQEWQRIETVGREWLKSQVAAFVPPDVTPWPDPDSSVDRLFAKKFPSGKLLILEPDEPGGTYEVLYRGPVLGRGTRGIAFKGTMVATGEHFAVKLQFVRKSLFRRRSSLLRDLVKYLQQEFAVRNMLVAAYGEENVQKKGMVLPLTVRRRHAFGDFITTPFSFTMFWNFLVFYPLMKCTLGNLLVGPHWPREARLFVAKRLIEIAAALQRAGVLHRDIFESKILLQEGSGDIFFADFGDASGKHMQSGIAWIELQLAESSRLGHLVYYVYTGKTFTKFWKFRCTDNVLFHNEVNVKDVPLADKLIRNAIKALITCNKDKRILPQEITASIPFFRDEPEFYESK